MKRGQVAMEYMVLFGLTSFMTLILIVLFTTQSNNVRSDLINAQTDKVSSEIVDAVQEVYFMGEPAQKTIRVTFPDNINNVAIQNNALIFYVQPSDVQFEIVKEADINMTGSIKTFAGVHNIVVKAQGGVVVISDT